MLKVVLHTHIYTYMHTYVYAHNRNYNMHHINPGHSGNIYNDMADSMATKGAEGLFSDNGRFLHFFKHSQRSKELSGDQHKIDANKKL